jgi:hypothetical protein
MHITWSDSAGGTAGNAKKLPRRLYSHLGVQLDGGIPQLGVCVCVCLFVCASKTKNKKGGKESTRIVCYFFTEVISLILSKTTHLIRCLVQAIAFASGSIEKLNLLRVSPSVGFNSVGMGMPDALPYMEIVKVDEVFWPYRYVWLKLFQWYDDACNPLSASLMGIAERVKADIRPGF